METIKLEEYKGFNASYYFDKSVDTYFLNSECGDINIQDLEDNMIESFKHAVDDRLKWLGHDKKQDKHATKIYSRTFKTSEVVYTLQPIQVGDVVCIRKEYSFFVKITERYNNNERSFVAVPYSYKFSLIQRLLNVIKWY